MNILHSTDDKIKKIIPLLRDTLWLSSIGFILSNAIQPRKNTIKHKRMCVDNRHTQIPMPKCSDKGVTTHGSISPHDKITPNWDNANNTNSTWFIDYTCWQKNPRDWPYWWGESGGVKSFQNPPALWCYNISYTRITHINPFFNFNISLSFHRSQIQVK